MDDDFSPSVPSEPADGESFFSWWLPALTNFYTTLSERHPMLVCALTLVRIACENRHPRAACAQPKFSPQRPLPVRLCPAFTTRPSTVRPPYGFPLGPKQPPPEC